MYVAPRPALDDDPLFPARLAAMAAIAFLLIPLLKPSLPPLLASLPIGLMAGMRKRFDPTKAVGGPLAVIVLAWVVAWLVELVKPMPAMLVVTVWSLYFASFYAIQRTGSPFGMLLLVVAVLLSIMGMNSSAVLDATRDSFTQAGLAALVVIPLLYVVFPVRTSEKMVENYEPAPGPHAPTAAIRATVLLGLTFWFYANVDPSNMILAIAAVLVMVFPTRERQFDEARQRVTATAMGALAALAILGAFSFMAHLPVLLGLVALAGLFFGGRMMTGTRPPMVPQFALSVTLALIAGALATQAPAYSAFTRVVLTLGGALGAAVLTATLEALLVRAPPSQDRKQQ